MIGVRMSSRKSSVSSHNGSASLQFSSRGGLARHPARFSTIFLRTVPSNLLQAFAHLNSLSQSEWKVRRFAGQPGATWNRPAFGPSSGRVLVDSTLAFIRKHTRGVWSCRFTAAMAWGVQAAVLCLLLALSHGPPPASARPAHDPHQPLDQMHGLRVQDPGGQYTVSWSCFSLVLVPASAVTARCSSCDRR